MNKKHVLASIDKVEGWLTKHEALLLTCLSEQGTGDGEIVEIGSYKGKSTIALAAGLISGERSGFVWAVDPHEGIIKNGEKKAKSTYTEFLENIKNAHVHVKIKPLVMTSERAANRWKYPIRLLFIDGLHDYSHTASDYAFWSPHVVNDGIIAFHDAFCGEEGVWKAVRSHCLHRKDIVDIGTVSSIIYVIFGKPTLVSRIKVFVKKVLYP